MTARTYDPAPLFALAERQGLNMSEMAERIGCHRSLLARWRREGGVPDRWADAAAVAVGRLPGELWPEWTEAAIAEVDNKEAERRRRDAAYSAAWKRRRYHTDPDVRAAVLEANRAYKAQAREVLSVKNAAYRAANREHIRLGRRQRYEANREAELARQREYDRRKRAERRAAQSMTSTTDNRWSEAS